MVAIRIIFTVLILFFMVFLFGIVFNIVFKIGILLILGLGVLYLLKKTFGD